MHNSTDWCDVRGAAPRAPELTNPLRLELFVVPRLVIDYGGVFIRGATRGAIRSFSVFEKKQNIVNARAQPCDRVDRHWPI